MRRNRQRHRQNGFILIVVLGAVLMLSALLYGFNQAARTSLDKADGFYSAEQVWSSAWAGLQIAVAAIGDTEDLSADPKWARLLDGTLDERARRSGYGCCGKRHRIHLRPGNNLEMARGIPA